MFQLPLHLYFKAVAESPSYEAGALLFGNNKSDLLVADNEFFATHSCTRLAQLLYKVFVLILRHADSIALSIQRRLDKSIFYQGIESISGIYGIYQGNESIYSG